MGTKPGRNEGKPRSGRSANHSKSIVDITLQLICAESQILVSHPLPAPPTALMCVLSPTFV